MPILTATQGGSGSSLTVSNDHIFTSNATRDSYFSSNPTELVEDLYVSSGDTLQKYKDGNWVDSSALIKGSTGEQGASVEAEYSANKTDWHTLADITTDKYIRLTNDSGATYTDAFTLVGVDGTDGYNLIIQYSVDGDNGWHTTRTTEDVYWRWSIDGGATFSDDFVRYSASQGVDNATVNEVGVVKVDGSTITVSPDGTISSTVGAATKAVVDSEAAMLSLPTISNLYIVTRSDLEVIYYLNANLDSSVLSNWVIGASIANTVASFNGRLGDVVPEQGDYVLEDLVSTDMSSSDTYNLEVEGNSLYINNVSQGIRLKLAKSSEVQVVDDRISSLDTGQDVSTVLGLQEELDAKTNTTDFDVLSGEVGNKADTTDVALSSNNNYYSRDLGAYREMWGKFRSAVDEDEFVSFPYGLRMANTGYSLTWAAANVSVGGNMTSAGSPTKTTSGFYFNRDNDVNDYMDVEWRVIGYKP